MEGKGVLTSVRGDVYQGQFKNGFKHGKGVINYADGLSSYDGDWSYNKIEGTGKSVDEYGNVYEGEFRDNCRSG